MRFEFLEPPRSPQPNLTSAETSGVIPLLKKLVQVHIYFLQGKEVLVPARRKLHCVWKKKNLRMAKIALRELIRPEL